MKCKFCGNESTLINAHVIPAGFFHRIRQGKEPLEVITNSAGEYTKKSQIGEYDQTIVCSKCETIWQEWDNYAQQLLAEEPLNGKARYYNNRKICYVVDNYEYSKLKLFFISMAWRASVSSRKFFRRVSLGQFEDIAKRHIMNGDPGDSEDFSIVVSKFNNPLAKSTLNPYTYQNSGVNYIRFYLAGYMADMKVDDKPTPNQLSQITMAENRPLCIICKDFMKSKELNVMKKLISS
jgi:hypothetical protein